MIIAFFKSHEDKDCKSEVVKFTDRLWIDKSGDIKCIRTFIVHVNEESTAPLKNVRLLTTFKQIQDLYDESDTCLNENYLYNKKRYSTGSYNVESIDEAQSFGIVSYDYFTNVKVYTNNAIKSYQSPDKTRRIISIEFKDHPILPGEYRLFRHMFKVTSTLDEVFPRVYNFSLNYFDDTQNEKDCKLLNIDKLEIPARKIIDAETRQGGFDIFLYLTDNLSCSNFNAHTQTTSKHLPDGSNSTNLCQKFIWRARTMVGSGETHLKCGVTPLSVEGLLNDTYEMEEIRKNIDRLKIDGALALKIGKIALVVSIISIIIAIVFGLLYPNKSSTANNNTTQTETAQ